MKFAINKKTKAKYYPLWVPFQHGNNGNVEELWVICKDAFCIAYRENCELDIIFTEMTDGETINGRDLAVSYEFQELLANIASENRMDPLTEMLTQYIKIDFPENGISKELSDDEILVRKQNFVDWLDQMIEQLSGGSCRYYFDGINEPFGDKSILTTAQSFQTTRFLDGTSYVYSGICKQKEDGGMTFSAISELIEEQCVESELVENPEGYTLSKYLEIFCDYYADDKIHYIGAGKKRFGRRENVSVCRYIGHDMPIVKIPKMYSGEVVSKIEEDAFREADLEEVFIPEGVKYIGNHAFEDCLHLKKIHLPMGIVQMDIETIPFDCVLVTEKICEFVKELCFSDRNIHMIGYELEDGTVIYNKEEEYKLENELPLIEEEHSFDNDLSALSDEISDLLEEVELALDKSEKNAEEMNTSEQKSEDSGLGKLAELEAILEQRGINNSESADKIAIEIPEKADEISFSDNSITDIMPEVMENDDSLFVDEEIKEIEDVMSESMEQEESLTMEDMQEIEDVMPESMEQEEPLTMEDMRVIEDIMPESVEQEEPLTMEDMRVIEDIMPEVMEKEPEVEELVQLGEEPTIEDLEAASELELDEMQESFADATEEVEEKDVFGDILEVEEAAAVEVAEQVVEENVTEEQEIEKTESIIEDSVLEELEAILQETEKAIDEPIIDDVVIEEPAVGESELTIEEEVVDEPVVDEVISEELVVDEVVSEVPESDESELSIDELIIDEVVTEESENVILAEDVLEPAMEEPEIVLEEAKADESIMEDSVENLEALIQEFVGEEQEQPQDESELVVEESIIDELVSEEPVVETPIIDELVVEEPVIEEPLTDESDLVVEEVVTDEPIIEEAITDELVIDELVIDEPVIEEVITDELVVEEPVADESELAIEKAVTEDVILDEAVIEESDNEDSELIVDELIIDELVSEEPELEISAEDVSDPAMEELEKLIQEFVGEEQEQSQDEPEPVVDESIIEELISEEPILDEMVIDEPLMDEPDLVIEEVVTDEPIIEEAITDELIVDEPELTTEEVVTEDAIIEEAVSEVPESEELDLIVEQPETSESELNLDEAISEESELSFEDAMQEESELNLDEVIAEDSEVSLEEVVLEEVVSEENASIPTERSFPLKIAIGERGNSFIALNLSADMLELIGITLDMVQSHPVMILGNYLDCAVDDKIIKYNILSKETSQKIIDTNVVSLLNSSVGRNANVNEAFRMHCHKYEEIMQAILTADANTLNQMLQECNSSLQLVESDCDMKVKDSDGEVHSMQEILWILSQNY